MTKDFELKSPPDDLSFWSFHLSKLYCQKVDLKDWWLNNSSNAAEGRCVVVLGWCSFLWCG